MGSALPLPLAQSHDRTEHEKDEDKSTFGYKINGNETVSNDNQDAEINKTEKDEKNVYSKVFQVVPK